MTVFGLPLHPLIVHATVVAVPGAALAGLLAAFWPRFRRWASWGPMAITALAVILVPITTSSGESLEHAMPRSAAIEAHAHLADGLLPWVIALLVGVVGLFWSDRIIDRPGRWTPPRLLRWAILLVIGIGAVGALVEVVLIGHSGASAAWAGVA